MSGGCGERALRSCLRESRQRCARTFKTNTLAVFFLRSTQKVEVFAQAAIAVHPSQPQRNSFFWRIFFRGTRAGTFSGALSPPRGAPGWRSDAALAFARAFASFGLVFFFFLFGDGVNGGEAYSTGAGDGDGHSLSIRAMIASRCATATH